ncbi:hypothetical protein JCM8208_006229 [Rhodotorula glutinis]
MLQSLLRRRTVALRLPPTSTRLTSLPHLASTAASPSRTLATTSSAREPSLSDKLRAARAQRTDSAATSTRPSPSSSADASAPSTSSSPPSASSADKSDSTRSGSDPPLRTAQGARIPGRAHVDMIETREANTQKQRRLNRAAEGRAKRRPKSATRKAYVAQGKADKEVAVLDGEEGVNAFEGSVNRAEQRPATAPEIVAKLDQITSLKRRVRKTQQLLQPWDKLTLSQRYRQIHYARPPRERRPDPAQEPVDAETGTSSSMSSAEAQARNAELEKAVADRWPETLVKLRETEKALNRELAKARKELGELRALPVPKKGSVPERDGPPLMEQIAQTLPLSGDKKKEEREQPASQKKKAGAGEADRAGVSASGSEKARTGRVKPSERRAALAARDAARGAAASGRAAQTSSSDRYTEHPALRGASSSSTQDDASPKPAADRELSSFQHVLNASTIPYIPRPSPLGDVPVATLAHSLDRVLFNPGVHFLRDPRTGVYNFARDVLENVPKVDEFDFDKLPQYITSSQDETLKGLLETEGRTFAGSTSSTIGMLCQIYFWLSKGKPINTGMLSSDFATASKEFSMGQQLPASVVLRYDNGRYSIDADKSFDTGIETNILAHYGHLMEKLLTTEASEFKRFLHDSEDPAPSEADHRQAYHYGMTDHLVLRSQLDAHNEYLPNKTFDLKTRGTVAIRQDRLNYEESAGYVIDKLRGPWESFEREYYDLIRSAFLKYQFQARIGCMDGIFVAYHSTARFYGFQYVPISEMDEALFGNSATGDAVFRLALGTLETILHRAKDCYPGESVNATFAVDPEADVLRVFVARQADVESRTNSGLTTVDGTVAASRSSASTDEAQDPVAPPPPIPMTLLEVRGASYLDGEAQDKPVTLPSSTAPTDGSSDDLRHPGARKTWQLAFDITASSSTSSPRDDEPNAVSPFDIVRLFGRTREHQQMFSSLYLPTGISPTEVRDAQAKAHAAGVELDESDLALRFPVADGLEYTSPSRGVKALRRRAREGEEKRKVEEERRRGDKVVEVRSEVVERDEVLE